jgi:hypothetical protein
MKVFMCTQGMWATVKSKGPIDQKMDQMALTTIVQSVLEAMVIAISEEETTKKLWKALKEMNVGEECVKKAPSANPQEGAC